jgi:hypothetical protein
MKHSELWQLARQVTGKLGSWYEGPMEAAIRSMGIEPLDGFRVIMPAYTFEPDPISAGRMRKRSPYNSPAVYETSFHRLRDVGFLAAASEGGYFLTGAGHTAFRNFVGAGYAVMRGLAALPREEMEELRTLLANLVQACILSPEPPGKWSILHSRRLAPEPGSDLPCIEQYISDLGAYRDDCHLASWAPYTVEAHAWDILTCIWSGKASTLADLLEALKRRLWTQEQTRQAVDDLRGRRWISGENQLRLTEQGGRIRDEAEEFTDRYFYAPWETLAVKEHERLCELLAKLEQKLQPGPAEGG